MNRMCQNALKANLRTGKVEKSETILSAQNSTSLHTSASRPGRFIRDKFNRKVTRRIIRPQQNEKKQSKKWPKLTKFLTPLNIVPKPIQPPPNLKPLMQPASAPKETQKKARRKLKQWLKDNAGIIILNFGSIASFLAFTKTDILELRLLSITGSLSSIVYFMSRPPPIVLGPLVWSGVFAGTNAYMVYYIYEERKGKPNGLTSQEEDVYEEHFLPHAVTPRQFEKVLAKAKKIELKRGDVLIQSGQQMDKFYLVISGCTEAVSTLSRRVTAASSSPGNNKKLAGGDAGAWVGDLAFLDYLADRDKSSGILNPPPPPLEDTMAKPTLATAGIPATLGKNEEPPNVKDSVSTSKTAITKNSILTYIATQDSTLYEWDFEELADLMKTSTDLRSALTRAMTAAVVGKVVNMYISRADADQPMWKKWLAGQSTIPVASNISAVKVNISQD
jgi:CRP-like cAMP-binding protein